MKLHRLPFHIGATEQSCNPNGLPNTYPYSVVFDPDLKVLTQPSSKELEQVLLNAYAVGEAFGTPLAEDDFGNPYAQDFLTFIQKASLSPRNGLEIGAGVGFLSRLLIDDGWDMTSLEPGNGYEKFWKKYGIQCLKEYFPTDMAKGPFDLIVSYGVLEHISEPLNFLKSVKDHLTDNGLFFLAVPDCTEEIAAADPSILFHEHFNYFDPASLERIVKLSGMDVQVIKSGFGRCLYAVAGKKSYDIDLKKEPGLEEVTVSSYPQRSNSVIRIVRQEIHNLGKLGSVGLYCAPRGLCFLNFDENYRFFDDNPNLLGKYYPPFACPIENRVKLMAQPVDNLIILSRTFGNKITQSLRAAGYNGNIIQLEELWPNND